MVEILRNKNLATRFQILIEVADKGPNIQQQDIARKLEITPQAVSDYIRQLTEEGFLSSDGRSRYDVTIEGVNWIIKVLKELSVYSSFAEKAITSISVCAAVADHNLNKGQRVGLRMKNGVLCATMHTGKGASGIAVTDAVKGQDVGVSDIEGIVRLEVGKVTVLSVPNIQQGGSGRVDIDILRSEVRRRPVIGSIGIEALIALRRISPRSSYIYGAEQAAIEAAKSGLNPLIVCVKDETSALIDKLDKEKISYEVIDIQKD